MRGKTRTGIEPSRGGGAPRPRAGARALGSLAATTLTVVREPHGLPGPRLARRPVLVLPLDSAVVTLTAGGRDERLDRAKLGLVPARVSFELDAHSLVAPTVTIELGEAAREVFFREYEGHVDAATLAEVSSRVRVFPRTRWVDELVHRYVFERTVCEKHTSEAARFLETELVKEVYFMGKEALANRTRASVVREDDPLVARARAYLEAHLFEDVPVHVLCTRFGTSESTLLRLFRRELGASPAEYARGRRLEEARLLLETGTYTASEIAVRVGYSGLPAFTVAFSRRFGCSPSSVRGAGNGRGAGDKTVLPPHGEPPVRSPAASRGREPTTSSSPRRNRES